MTTQTTQTAEKTETKETLTVEELKTLKSAEASIRNGLKSYQSIGRALTVINQGRLYRAEFSTFKKYCATKWDFTTARASQYMAAYRIHELLTMTGFKVLPKTESQCRPLVRIPQDEQMDTLIIKAWTAVIDAKQAITAKLVNDIVDGILGIDKDQGSKADSADGEAGTAGSARNGSAGEQSASAEMRAEIRALKRKVAYLESCLAAEKRAHQQTAKRNGLPKSDMARDLYKAGYRVLAKKHHPDHGGDARHFEELTALKEELLS